MEELSGGKMKRKILVTIPLEEEHKRKIENIASDTEE